MMFQVAFAINPAWDGSLSVILY